MHADDSILLSWEVLRVGDFNLADNSCEMSSSVARGTDRTR